MYEERRSFFEIGGIFQEVFDDESLVITETTTAADIENWDSFEFINLIIAIEEEFGFKFPVEETTKLESVGEIVDGIMKHSK